MIGSYKYGKGLLKHPGYNSDFFDDVLGFDPNGGGIHDTFVGKVLDNPIVSTVLKFTPAAPLSWGYDASSAAGSGNWLKAGLSGLGAYGSLGGFDVGGNAASTFVAEDAAQLAAQGLDSAQIADILGQSYGLDAVTSSMIGQNAFMGMSPAELAKFSGDLGGYGNWGFSATPYDPSVAASINPQLKMSQTLGGLSGATAAPLPGMATSLGTSGGFESFQPPDFGLANQMKISTNLGLSPSSATTSDLATTLGNLGKYGQLGQTGSTMSGVALPQTSGTAPIEEATGQQNPNYKPDGKTSLGDLVSNGANYVSDHLMRPITEGANKLVSWSGGKLPDIFGTGNTGIDMSDLIGAGVKTMGAMDIAGDLEKQAQLSDVFANQRNYATSKWTNAYDDPESLFQEYMKGPGAQYMKSAAAKMAASGNRGQLPTLMNQARENFYSNYLPQYRQGVNPSQFNSKPDSSLYGAAANAKGTAYSAIPNALSSIFGRKYRTTGVK